MIRIALLGFGVVGSGTAEVLTENRALLAARAGEEIDIRYILDRREFPDHPLGDRVVHDIAPILADPEIRVVAEMMGGAHPAYEFTRAALEAVRFGMILPPTASCRSAGFSTERPTSF